jgi:hypothetical protein
MAPSPKRVWEPVQVFLDGSDKKLLEDVARRTGLAQAEILRRGLRQVASDSLRNARQALRSAT